MAVSTARNVLAAQIGILLGALALWEMGARSGALDPFFFSQPSAFFGRAWEWLVHPREAAPGGRSIYGHLGTTLFEMAGGFASGATAGILFGFFLAQSDFWASVLKPYIQVLNALPRLVLAPLFVLVLGIDETSKIALVFTLVFFIVFFNAYTGVRDVDRVVLANARLLGADRWALARHVLLPSAMTWILGSLHTSVGFALVGAVVGEYLAASRGLGWVIGQAQGNFDSAGVYAGIVILCAIVLPIELGVSLLERRLLKWKPPAPADLLAA